jgi:hypothetical protein
MCGFFFLEEFVYSGALHFAFEHGFCNRSAEGLDRSQVLLLSIRQVDDSGGLRKRSDVLVFFSSSGNGLAFGRRRELRLMFLGNF